MQYQMTLVVRPREGVRDPQGDAVEESLKGVGYEGVTVACVGRYLRFAVNAPSQNEAEATAHDMCRRLLVNPNLESYTLTVEAEAAADANPSTQAAS